MSFACARRSKCKIAKDAEILSRRLADQRALQQRAVVARKDDKIFDTDFDQLKRSVAEETFKIEAQITALDQGKEQLRRTDEAGMERLRCLGHFPYMGRDVEQTMSLMDKFELVRQFPILGNYTI